MPLENTSRSRQDLRHGRRQRASRWRASREIWTGRINNSGGRADVEQLADWLSTTFMSVFIKTHNGWAIPTIQFIHIVGVSVVLGSVLMINLRLLGWAGMDQTL